MNHLRRSAHRRTVVVALGAVLVVACKIEPVLEADPPLDAPSPVAAGPMVPWAESRDDEGDALRRALRRDLAMLTGPRLSGRRPGSDGATLTTAHLEMSMRAFGLVPAGLGGGWRQPTVARLREVESARIVLAEDAASPDAVALVHPDEIIVWQEADGAWQETLTLVDVGFGVRASAIGRDDYAGVDARGKLLLARTGVGDEQAWTDELRALHGPTAHKLEVARKAGARGLLIETSSLCTDPSWRTLVAELGGPRIDVPTKDRGGADPPLEGSLCVESGAKLRAWLAADGVTPAGGRSVVVDGVSSKRLVLDPNVVGRIPGAQRPEEVVLLMAHWDAGGVTATLPDGGGGADNASGVATLLAIAEASAARVAQGRAPSRTIAFAATASDTLDLLGATALLGDGPFNRAQIVAVVNLDVLVAAGGAPMVVLGTDPDLLARLAVLGVEPPPESAMPGPHPRLAHEIAQARGVPAVTLTRHVDGDSGGVEQLSEPPSALVHDAEQVLALMWALADAATAPVANEGAPTPEAAPAATPAKPEPAAEPKPAAAPEAAAKPDGATTDTPAAAAEPAATK